MTIMIGIHQKQDKIDNLYENLGLRAASLATAGPFASKEEALEWQEGVHLKLKGCSIIEPLGPDVESVPWYGFSFEK